MTAWDHDALNVVNALLCTGIWWACLCRLNLLSSESDWRPRAMFTLVVLGATANGFAPILFAEPAGVGDCLLSATLFMGLLITSHRWRHGAPDELTAADEMPTRPMRYPYEVAAWEETRQPDRRRASR